MPNYENYLRSMVSNMSLVGVICMNPISKQVLDKYSIKYSLSRSWRLGRSIIYSRLNGLDLSKTLNDLEGSKEIFKGKISDIKNEAKEGFNKGFTEIEGMDEYGGKVLEVMFQNENLIARLKGDNNALALSPDIISILDVDNFEPILCENLKYGIRVIVVVLPCPDLLKTEEALKVTGPKNFGYDNIEYVECGDYKNCYSVINEYYKN
jgi:DUF917 family protein